jgi:hypothetical protein
MYASHSCEREEDSSAEEESIACEGSLKAHDAETQVRPLKLSETKALQIGCRNRNK